MTALPIEDDKFLKEQETARKQFHRYVRLHYGVVERKIGTQMDDRGPSRSVGFWNS